MSEGKHPGKVRKAARRAWGSLFGQEVLGQEETAQVMRQEVFGVEIGLHTGGGGGELETSHDLAGTCSCLGRVRSPVGSGLLFAMKHTGSAWSWELYP